MTTKIELFLALGVLGVMSFFDEGPDINSLYAPPRYIMCFNHPLLEFFEAKEQDERENKK